MSSKPFYKRILLKLSGEALMGDQDFGIDPKMLDFVAKEVNNLVQQGVQVALVIGGGNIFRGVSLASGGMDRVAGDHMGMLATVINSLAMQNTLENHGMDVRVMSALPIQQMCDDYVKRDAVRHLQQGRVIILTAGTGNPFFTTDSAASLRGMEIGADVVIKATNVDGVYDSDPRNNPDAKMYSNLSYDQVIAEKLNVMDTTAIVLCRDQEMPIRVCNMNHSGLLEKIVVDGEHHGTIVE
ncbi:MAG: UMP kinase [Gammaproteobacteria bacterium]|nr:UMP kinase [Gammaproteobacteria bacterium]